MKFILKYLLLAGFIVFCSYYFSSIIVANYKVAIAVALFIGFVNAILKPILKVLTFPIQLLTLGLFSLVLNGILIKFVDWFFEGYEVKGFLTAILFGTAISIVSGILDGILDSDDNDDE